MALSQGIFHTLFAWGAVDATLTGAASAHHPEPGALAVHSTGHSHTDAAMLASHVLAAVATIVVIRRADALWRALSRLASQLVRFLCRRLSVRITPLMRGQRPLAMTASAPAPTRSITSQPAVLRGPPALLS